MTQQEFERLLGVVVAALASEARISPFSESKQFETRVREVVHANLTGVVAKEINFSPHLQAFPDIAVGEFGIEVKFTTGDTWRSVANSILETNRIDAVKKVYVIFGKMGGEPGVKWAPYDKCVIHVRTSHVPRFEVELDPMPTQSLFEQMGIPYDDFRISKMEEKMKHIRQYARGRLNPGERLWWLEYTPDSDHTLPIQARLYTKIPDSEKARLRAEAVLLCPQIVKHGRSKNKYDDAVLYLLTYHGVLCHQARDLFSAGSVANPDNDDDGGIYIERALKLLEQEILAAAIRMEDEIFVEYWGESVPPADRIEMWLRMADDLARDWVPSQSLFLEYQRVRLSTRPRTE